jgi:hypothetical protein
MCGMANPPKPLPPREEMPGRPMAPADRQAAQQQQQQ